MATKAWTVVPCQALPEKVRGKDVPDRHVSDPKPVPDEVYHGRGGSDIRQSCPNWLGDWVTVSKVSSGWWVLSSHGGSRLLPGLRHLQPPLRGGEDDEAGGGGGGGEGGGGGGGVPHLRGGHHRASPLRRAVLRLLQGHCMAFLPV